MGGDLQGVAVDVLVLTGQVDVGLDAVHHQAMNGRLQLDIFEGALSCDVEHLEELVEGAAEESV